MIQIYLNTNKNFNYNGDMLLKPTSAVINRDLKDFKDELELIQEIDETERWTYIEEDNVIKCPRSKNLSEDQLYRIYETEKEDKDTITARCRHIVFDLINFKYEYEKIDAGTNQTILNKILLGTGFTGSFSGSISNLKISFETKDKNRWETLVLFSKVLKCEISASNHSILLTPKIGNQTPILKIAYARNMTAFSQTINIDEVATQIKGTYNGYNTGWKNSPTHFNDYANPKQKIVELKDITTVAEIDDDGNITNESEIISEMTDKVLAMYSTDSIDIPVLNYKVGVTDLAQTKEYANFKGNLEQINLGDMVTIIHKKYKISTDIRVISLKYDILNNENSDLELGEKIYDVIEDINKDNQDVKDSVEELANNVIPAVNTAISNIPTQINTALNTNLKHVGGELSGEGTQTIDVNMPSEWAGKVFDCQYAFFRMITPPSSSSLLLALKQATINVVWISELVARITMGVTYTDMTSDFAGYGDIYYRFALSEIT